ncbi:hypothetical protein F511_12590 [Dorcoceras hygrometricum]|uniref:Uncharacterized protein n=1 Tax=Dorcoceras hygrometricum TaxID=472368 RepID=A0A2Z7CYU9_9LAMI|nr:hypothetical protein F511_12590 [Dorcoceras hygrometricum]
MIGDPVRYQNTKALIQLVENFWFNQIAHCIPTKQHRQRPAIYTRSHRARG